MRRALHLLFQRLETRSKISSSSGAPTLKIPTTGSFIYFVMDELTASDIRCMRRNRSELYFLVMSWHSKLHPSRSSGSSDFLLPPIPLRSTPFGQRWYSDRHVWLCPGRSQMQQLSSWTIPETHGASKKRELTSRTYVAMRRA